MIKELQPGVPVKTMVVFGTRPEIVKMAPVVAELEARPGDFAVSTLLTAQHRDMSDVMLDLFGIEASYDLDLMRHGQTLPDLTSSVLHGVRDVLEQDRPDLVLVQGDTVTVFATALAAFYTGVPVGHVEAGLRTHNKRDPYPEEMMRRLTGPLADLHLAPTAEARANLRAEGTPEESIYLVGNTVIDALLEVAEHDRPVSSELGLDGFNGRRMILVTAHRRENWGHRLEQICHALETLAGRFDDVVVVYAMHPNPKIRDIATRILGDVPNVALIGAPHYGDFVGLIKRSHLILTDSGGVQEEAPSLGKPVLVMRDTTERREGVTAGTAKLVGVETNAIVAAATELLTDDAAYQDMAQAVNPYGDGLASARIADAILHAFDRGERPRDFVPLTRSATVPAA